MKEKLKKAGIGMGEAVKERSFNTIKKVTAAILHGLEALGLKIYSFEKKLFTPTFTPYYRFLG
jgi:hypothetical protein